MLLAVLLGTLLAWPMGLVNFASVKTVDWFGGPQIFHFGGPKFQASAIISLCIVMLVTYTESTADMLAVSKMVGKEVSPSELVIADIPGPVIGGAYAFRGV